MLHIPPSFPSPGGGRLLNYKIKKARKTMQNTSPIQNKTLSFMDVVRFAATYWLKQPCKWIVILLMVLSAALVEAYLPTALAAFLKTIRVNNAHPIILHYLLIFIGLYFTQAMLLGVAYLLYNIFETRLFKSLIDDAYSHIQRLPEQFFVNTFTGSIISKMSRARYQIEVFEDQILVRIFPTLVVLIGSLIFLSLRFPMLAVLLFIYLIVLVAVTAFLVFCVSGPAQGHYANAQDAYGAHLADTLSGMATTKTFAQEKMERNRFLDTTKGLHKKNLRAYLLGNTARIIQSLLLTGMLAVLMGGGTWYYFHGLTTVENMAYLAFAYTIMQSYIRDVGENIKNLLTSSYDLHGVIHLLQENPEVAADVKPSDLNISKGEIVFDHVSFTYPGKKTPVFNDLSITIKAGERVALIGHSGGGKTSFVRLLQCLYTMQKGHIYIDGQDIATHSRESLRSAIALVPQDPILFHRTLRENIAYARPDASLQEIQAAARQAHIDEFIMSLPLHYETLVGERGIKLSGGERQRIAIARAILADRPILILDEATSSLDSESERVIQDALHSLIKNRTSIMIAHRLSTILDSDRILVFDAGKIVEAGTHAELIQKTDGIYANLFKLQSGGFISD